MDKQFLCFRLGDERYLVDIATVQEIIPYRTPNPVPGTSRANLGMLDIRGNIIALFSGHALLSLDEPPEHGNRKIIIFEDTGFEFGVVVDELAEILALDQSNIEHPIENEKHSMITGTLTHNGKLLIMIDFSQCAAITQN